MTNTGEIANYYQDLFVGFYGTGEFVQSGQSDSSMGDIELGRWEDSNGTYELTDATLAAQQLFVGRDGTGVFTQTSGSLFVLDDDLHIGENAPGIGTFTLSGASSVVEFGDDLHLGTNDGATGTFTMSDGEVIKAILRY